MGGGNKISSSATVSCQPQSWMVEENGKRQGPKVYILEGNSPTNSPANKKLKNVRQDDVVASTPTSFRHVSKLIKKIEEFDFSVRKAEHAAVDGVFDAKKYIFDQIKLKAPDLDVSEVDAFKKVVDLGFRILVVSIL
ncbi:hypothetical protein AHAS_Ahas20G0202500 [Arachis hypogaea]